MTSTRVTVWVVYYKGRVHDPPSIIGIVHSEEEARKMVQETHAHESAEGWTHDETAFVEIPLGENLVISGPEGPVMME